MKPEERLHLMARLLDELMEQIAGDRDNCTHVGPRALSARIDAVLEDIKRVRVQVGLLTVEVENAGDLRAKGWNAAIDATQDMGRSAAYLQAGEFVGLLEHIRKTLVA